MSSLGARHALTCSWDRAIVEARKQERPRNVWPRSVRMSLRRASGRREAIGSTSSNQERRQLIRVEVEQRMQATNGRTELGSGVQRRTFVLKPP